MIGIRGAITVRENSKEEILASTRELLEALIEQNDITVEDIISIHFSATKDLTKAYPAVAARELGLTECSLFCVQEMYVEESLDMCIRALVYVENGRCQKEAKHTYLKGATVLRPDIKN